MAKGWFYKWSLYWTVRVRLQRRDDHKFGQKNSYSIFVTGIVVVTRADQFVT